MSSAYFASLVCLPVIIDEPGKYLTRCGETVSIDKVSLQHNFGCTGEYVCETREGWHKSGRLYGTFECGNDIISKK